MRAAVSSPAATGRDRPDGWASTIFAALSGFRCRVANPCLISAPLSIAILVLFDFVVIFGLLIVIAGCTTLDGAPEVRTVTVQVKVPVAVPCLTEADRPVLAPPTPIDPETATTEQLAAAELADAVALADFAAAVDRLYTACLQKGSQ